MVWQILFMSIEKVYDSRALHRTAKIQFSTHQFFHLYWQSLTLWITSDTGDLLRATQWMKFDHVVLLAIQLSIRFTR